MDFHEMYRRQCELFTKSYGIEQKAKREKRAQTPAEDRQIKRLDDEAKYLGQMMRDPRMAGREDIGDEPEKRSSSADRDAQLLEFTQFIGGRLSPEQRLRWDKFQAEERALSADTGPSVVATGTAGASTVAQGFPYEIDTATKFHGGTIEAADYVDTDTGAPMPYPTLDDTSNTGEQTAENDPVTGSDASGAGAEVDPTFGVAAFAAYMFDSGFIRVPVQLIQDCAFDTAAMILDQCGIRVMGKVNNRCTLGTGSGEPQGIVVASTFGATAAAPTAIEFDDLTGLKFSVDRSYRDRPKCGWMFADSTLQALAELKDKDDRPLLPAGGTSEGIQNGEPPTLLGHPYWINNDMAGIGASGKSILFGDFSKYKIRRVRTMGINRFDQLFMANLQIGFLAWQRFDGRLVNSAAIKHLIHPAS